MGVLPRRRVPHGGDGLPIDTEAAGDDDWLYTRLAVFASDPQIDDDARETARNLLQNRIIALSDQVSGEYLAKVARNEDLVNVGLGGSALLFDALGTALTGVDASRAMSAASGFATAGRELVNEEVYQNAFGPAIIKTIATARQNRALELAIKRRDMDITQYPVGDAIADAIAYHEMASFFSGLMAVQTDVYRGQAQLSNQTQTLRDEVDGTAAKAARDAAKAAPP